jgi:Raf kinase inhibitor-like YbhB/YbcL family protein
MSMMLPATVVALGTLLQSPNDPFAGFPKVPTFSLVATGLETGKRLPRPQWSARNHAGGSDLSPALRWKGAPAGTRSYAVTVFDPDAPGTGFWHWAVVDIPGNVGELPEGAGSGSSDLPKGAFDMENDMGQARYMGAAPPPGSGVHRYVFSVHALDVPSLKLPKGAPARKLAQAMAGHELARATVVGLAQR